MARILFTVSSRVSPLLTLLLEAVKLTISALRRRSASSKDTRVRVLLSKNRLATVTSRSEGTFLIGRLITSLKLSAVSKISLISSSVISLIPVRWRDENFFTLQELSFSGD
jgi:hypothetical protein